MTVLEDGRRDEIASLLAGLVDLSAAGTLGEAGEEPQKGALYDSLLASVKGGADTQIDKAELSAKIASVYGAQGQFIDSLQAFGAPVQVAAGALTAVLNSGQISEEEAESFLATEFPQYQFNGVEFGDKAADALEVKAAEAAAKATVNDPQAAREYEDVRRERGLVQAGEVSTNPTEQQPINPSINLPNFGEEFNSTQVWSSIRVALDSVQGYLSQVFRGQISYGQGTVPGSALRPGSVALNRVDFADMALLRRTVPGPEQAIQLGSVLDETADRWCVETNGTAGPGRIRRVTDRSYPGVGGFDDRPSSGPQRYRVVVPNAGFTILSMRWTSGPASFPPTGADELEVVYGFVLRDIPHFLGRPPHQILYAGTVGAPPGALSRVHQGSSVLMQTRAQNFYNAPTRWSIFGGGGGATYEPSSAYLGTIEGLGFTLLTGQNSTEVHAQLNGHESQSFAYIEGEGTGPTASVPPGLTVPPVTVGSVTGANSTAYTSANFWHDTAAASRDLEQAAGADASNLVTEGVPFVYEDCARLAATNETFSLVVQILPSFKIPGNSVDAIVTASGADTRVSRWYQNGLRPVDSDRLPWAIDVVVV